MKAKFIIITPAYNCREKISRTLFSVIGQTYKNWKMIILDDMSSDGTREYIEEFINQHAPNLDFTIKKRTEKYGEVRNTVEETANLHPEDIVVRLDAGDWLTDLGCFEILKSIYEKYDPAVVWTAHRWAFTDYNISGQIDGNISLYNQPWKTSHLKTFRVKDFLGINPKNFLDNEGNYIMIACDQAVFLPMLERARRNKRPLIFRAFHQR